MLHASPIPLIILYKNNHIQLTIGLYFIHFKSDFCATCKDLNHTATSHTKYSFPAINTFPLHDFTPILYKYTPELPLFSPLTEQIQQNIREQ